MAKATPKKDKKPAAVKESKLVAQVHVDTNSMDALENIPTIGVVPVCINCRFLATGLWRGPQCQNPASPEFGTHRPDQGTCAKFTAKTILARPLIDEEADSPNEEEDNKATLQQMLDAETVTPATEQDDDVQGE